MAGKTRSKNQQTKYATYKTRMTWAENKRLKLERHLKQQPNDTVAQAALKAQPKYARRTPNTKTSTTARRTLQLFKLLEGKAPQTLVSSNPQVAAQARMAHKAPKLASLSAKGMFALGTRANIVTKA